MNANSRACVAYVAAKLISGLESSSVYDFVLARKINFEGKVAKDEVDIIDLERGCALSGKPEKLYDHGNDTHIRLDMQGNMFRGYDHGDAHDFQGTVRGNRVQIFDNQESKYYNYSI